MFSDIFKEILKARVYHLARRTPLETAQTLSRDLHNHILIKREDLQPIFSFKIRGACNLISQIKGEKARRGVICASAGNHGQGVALSAQKLEIPAWVVMPSTTPDIKIQAVRRYGAEVVLSGEHYSQAQDRCSELLEEFGATMVHPFDDPLVIAGQGTVGKEILEDSDRTIDGIFVPVGGGGLLAGIAVYVKTLYPEIKIIGVEPEDSDAMQRSVAEGHRIELSRVGLFADGVAVRQVGDLTFQIAQHFVDGFIRVTTDEICSAIQDIYRESRSIVEPAGALSLAGLKAYLRSHKVSGKTYVTINSGANMNFHRLQFIAERALTGIPPLHQSRAQEALLS
jgi:threonine dehydratase